MSDRRPSLNPVERLDPVARVQQVKDRMDAKRSTDGEPEPKGEDTPTPEASETYRMVIDPQTLRAVTEVRDPETGKVRFTVPATAEYERNQKLGSSPPATEPTNGPDEEPSR